MVCEDMISALPQDLLVTILSLVPTKDAVATMFLSKRWFSIWTMIYSLEYKDDDVDDSHSYGSDDEYEDENSDDEYEDEIEDLGDKQGQDESRKSVWFFLNKSLQLNKAYVIDSLSMELGLRCPTNADVGKWVAYAVSRCVRELNFNLRWSADPTSLPCSLYSCPSLVELTLSHKILVDVPSSASLPSLKILRLHWVVYKDNDSLVSFLSSCPVLETLSVKRMDDNVTIFSVKVPSLLHFAYVQFPIDGDTESCLVIDTPALSYFRICDYSRFSCSVKMPCLNTADIVELGSCPDGKFLALLSLVSNLTLFLSDETVVCCSSVKFSRLTTCLICPGKSDWMEPVILLLQNSPKMNFLLIDYEHTKQPDKLPLIWNQPSSVPECLASQLEYFQWEGYESQVEEDEFLAYVLANSKCLKTVEISPSSRLEGLHEWVREDLEKILRVSTECQLIYHTDT